MAAPTYSVKMSKARLIFDGGLHSINSDERQVLAVIAGLDAVITRTDELAAEPKALDLPDEFSYVMLNVFSKRYNRVTNTFSYEGLFDIAAGRGHRVPKGGTSGLSIACGPSLIGSRVSPRLSQHETSGRHRASCSSDIGQRHRVLRTRPLSGHRVTSPHLHQSKAQDLPGGSSKGESL